MQCAAASAAPTPDEAPAARAGDVSAFLDRVRGTNVSETTLLATDYLNHFNEVVMLLEMVPDMPEMFDEVQAWQPKSYVEHFSTSNSPFSELAAELYPHVPPRYREPFDITIGHLAGLIDRTVRNVENALAKQDTRAVRDRIDVALGPMRRLIDVAGGIIHGADQALSQDEIDSLIGR
jgi:hypothetical protein